MKAVGTKTDERTKAMPITGPESSSIAFRAASLGFRPSSMWRCTPSTTTIASSTTRPIASTSPNIERVLMEKPKSGNRMKVPTRETGTANSGTDTIDRRDDAGEIEIDARCLDCGLAGLKLSLRSSNGCLSSLYLRLIGEVGLVCVIEVLLADRIN